MRWRTRIRKWLISNREGGEDIPYIIEWIYFHDSVLVAFILISNIPTSIIQSTMHLAQACRMLVFYQNNWSYKVILAPFSSNSACAKKSIAWWCDNDGAIEHRFVVVIASSPLPHCTITIASSSPHLITIAIIAPSTKTSRCDSELYGHPDSREKCKIG